MLRKNKVLEYTRGHFLPHFQRIYTLIKFCSRYNPGTAENIDFIIFCPLKLKQ